MKRARRKILTIEVSTAIPIGAIRKAKYVMLSADPSGGGVVVLLEAIDQIQVNDVERAARPKDKRRAG